MIKLKLKFHIKQVAEQSFDGCVFPATLFIYSISRDAVGIISKAVAELLKGARVAFSKRMQHFVHCWHLSVGITFYEGECISPSMS